MHALLRKELREHRWVLLGMSVVLALLQLSMLLAAESRGSPMVAYQVSVTLFAPLMALLLANRLVVREYMGRTQLFLETLPVNRAQVLALKWLLGAALLLLAMAVCFGVTLLVARGRVVLTPHYMALVAIRSTSFIFLAYALAFAIGLTGRYRHVIWIVLIACVSIANVTGQLSIGQWPPFYLVQETMVYERLQLPLRAVLITCGVAVALVAATFALALSAQGSLVVALSRRMTPREKSGVTIGMLLLIMAFGVIESRKPKPAFALQDAVRSEGGPAVAVGRVDDPSEALKLANLLSSDLARLQTFLALPEPPALAALPDDALDGDVFQRAALPNADGVVVRAAFTNSQFDRAGFRAYALASWMRWHSRERAAMEERRWVLDGAAQWLVARDLPQQQEILALRAAFAARLLQARGRDAGSAVRQWLTVSEELGTCLSDALAWRMVSALAQQMGEQRFQGLARAVLAVRPPDDARASLFEPSFAQILAQAQAPDRATLAQQFNRLFSAEQARLASTLDQIAMPKVSFAARRMDGSTYEVHYQVGNGPGTTALPFSVRYVELGPWDSEIQAELLARVDTTRSGVLPASFARGTRLFTAVERPEALLNCSVRLAAQRWEIK
jgi:ABC-type transport system involved in multi-copper enzyme maturation permease subunit